MQVNSTNVSLGDVNQIILSLGGVIQKPGTDFTVSGSTLTFTTDPASGTSFFAILLGSDNGGTVTPTDGSVTGDKVASTGAFTIGAAGTASSLAGIPFYNGDTTSIYTHDVSGTDDTASNNTAYGIAALDAVTQADNAVCIGYNAGTAMTTGGNNTIMGSQAGEALTSGGSNMFIGRQAGDGQDTENHNVGIGRNALGGAINGGEYNTAIGNNTLDACTSGDYNVAVGYDAGTDLTTGERNTFIGHEAGKDCVGGGQNVAIGDAAGSGALSASAGRNIMIGRNAGQSMTSTTGCTLIGYEAGRAQNYDGAAYVTMVGYQAGEDQTSSAYNTGFGAFNQKSSDTEDHNTSIGYYAMNGANGGGEYNTALGSYVLSDASQSGDYNVGVGWRALYGNTSGGSNNAVCYLALTACADGELNNAMGDRALTAVVGGDKNVGIGQQAGFGITSGSNNICIGFDSGRSSSPSGNITTASNQLCLGDDNISAFFCADTSISSSDKRDKTDVTNFTAGLSFIEKMQPVTYKWDKRSWYSDDLSVTPDGSKKATETNVGFLAQDVETLEKEIGFANNKNDMLFVNITEDNKRYGMKYERLVTVLVNAVKELSAKVKALEEA